MEGVVSIAGAFATMTFIVWAFLQALLRWREISRESQIMSQLASQVRGGEEAAAFLESSSAQALFDRMMDRRTFVLQRVLRALQSGVVLSLLGIAMFVIRSQFAGDDAVAALVIGTISLALGVAFLIAAGMSYVLSSRWGLLKETD